MAWSGGHATTGAEAGRKSGVNQGARSGPSSTCLGPLRLTTLCEAVQEGRAGQMIRVRNVDSRAERVGRVVDRNTVELDQEGAAPVKRLALALVCGSAASKRASSGIPLGAGDSRRRLPVRGHPPQARRPAHDHDPREHGHQQQRYAQHGKGRFGRRPFQSEGQFAGSLQQPLDWRPTFSATAAAPASSPAALNTRATGSSPTR